MIRKPKRFTVVMTFCNKTAISWLVLYGIVTSSGWYDLLRCTSKPTQARGGSQRTGWRSSSGCQVARANTTVVEHRRLQSCYNGQQLLSATSPLLPFSRYPLVHFWSHRRRLDQVKVIKNSAQGGLSATFTRLLEHIPADLGGRAPPRQKPSHHMHTLIPWPRP